MGSRELDLGRLAKPVGALAVVPQSSSITRVGRQAYNSMLFLAQQQGEGVDPFFQAPLSEILTGFAAAKDAAKEVKRHLRSMLTTLVEWQSPSPAEANWGACTLLAEAHLEKVKGVTWVRWAYPPSIRAELLNPQRYAQINMTTIAQLRTHAAVALYEICARYRDNPAGVTSRQHWTWWLPVLTGTPAEGRKTEYRFFKRDFINPAVDNINEVSDLTIAVKEHKRGRAIEEIQFSVARKPSVEQGRARGPVDMSQIVRAQGLGLPAGLAEELQYRFSVDALRLALDALERRNAVKHQEPIADPVAYVRAVVKNGRAHQVAPAPAPAVATPSVLPPVPPPPQALSLVEQRAAWEKQRLAQLRQELEEVHPDELATYLKQLRETLVARGGMQSLVRRIDAGQWRSPLVLHELIATYARANYGHAWNEPEPELPLTT